MRLLILLSLICCYVWADIIPQDPDTGLDIYAFIRKHGFEVEIHEVTTEDGYILELQRIVDVHKEKKGNQSLRRPVILQHGLMGSGADFLVNSPFLYGPNGTIGDNLAFSLHLTERYDVWLSNSRGNGYSHKHRTYTTDDLAYWEFSYDQMAEFDLPAVIDYVKSHTGFKTVGYIGYSQGTTTMFALLALKPEYASVVQPYLAMAPAAYFRNTRSPMKYYAAYEWVLKVPGGRYEPKNVWLEEMTNLYCRQAPKVCANSLFLMGGFDFARMNETRMPVYMSIEPAPTSMWVFGHWGQAINSRRFNRFDYGMAGNWLKYGSFLAPDWPLKDISKQAKIGIFQGKNDWLATPEDIDILRQELRANGVEFIEDFEVADKNWAHTDFAFAKGAGEMVYKRMIEVLDVHTKAERS